jgi:DNA-binding SARP family transcriptional activator/replicative DNA helicase
MPQTKQQNTAETQAVNWRLELLHVTQTQVLFNGQVLETLDRRSALLFAYLALEGSTPRSKMAGLLYPNNTDDTARANLRQRLKRLRDTFGTDLIVPEDTLRLRPDLEVDAVQLESLAFTGEYEKAVLFGGKLLPNLEPDDSPELSEWLDATRERLNAAWREALENEAERLEKTNLAQALELALRLLENDVLSEQSHSRVMRLYYLLGDRSSALKAFERLKTTLANELGVEPLPQTLELLRVIESGEITPQHAPKATPVTLQRPPVLVGREHEWRELENAWTKGQMIVIFGEAGAGKTRLALDFLASKGEFTRFDGRPGDALVSYSTHARTYRQMLENYQIDLPEWVRLELSRILPELGVPSSPIQNETDKLRFYQAKAEATRLAVEAGMQNVFLDDLQFMDDASFESGFGIYLQNTQNASMHTMLTCREAELSILQLQTLKQAFDSGQAVQIKLSPLEQHEVQAMLESLGVSGLERFGANMHKATGGNPMFVLETARDLVSSGNLEQSQTQALPLPKSVSAAIRNRLTKLEPPAMRLARVASVAATDFTLSLAAQVLETHVMDLSESITELEKAQVLQGLTFTHDLIAQTTLEGLPLSVRNLLYERIAVYLEKIDGMAARIAHHWIGAGQETKAVPHLIRAAEHSLEQGIVQAAGMQYQQAARIAESFDKKQSFDLHAETLACMMDYEFGSEFEDSLNKMFELARDSHQLVLAYDWKAELASLRGNYHEAIAACDMALQYAIPDSEEFAMILNQKQGALANIGQVNESLDCLLLMERIYITLENSDDLVTLFNNLGLIYHKLGRHQLAQDYQKRAIEMQSDQILRIRGQNSYLISHVELGEIRKARDEILAIWLEFKDTVKESRPRIVTLTNLAVSSLYISEMKEALSYLEEISLDIEGSQFWKTSDYHRFKGMILFELGQFETAQTHLQTALGYGFPMGLKGSAWLLLARCAAQLNEDFQVPLLEAEKMMVQSGDRRLYRQFQLMNAEFLPPKKALEVVQEILKEAEGNNVHGSEITAHTRFAQAYLSLKQPKKALKHMEAAATLLLSFDSNHIRRNEIMLTHCQVLPACNHSQFLEQLQKTLNWLLETANNHVPPEYRESFLTKNPHNAAILELARRAGFIVQIESANVSV